MKRSKTIVAFFLIAAFLCGCTPQKQPLKELKIFNWGEYMADGSDGGMNVLKKFESETGIHVTTYDTYDSNEQMYAKIKSGSADYDLVFPSDYMISRMISEDMLQPISFDNIPNSRYILDEYTGKVRGYDPTGAYSVPYTWGTVGIVYNRPLVEQKTGQKASDVVQGWDAFWNPKLSDSMYMFINARDSFAIAEKRLGLSLNETDPEKLRQAAELLEEQKPMVQAYVMDEMFDKMENGEAAISPAYAGDIITMMEENSDLAYCFPKEGTNLFVDAACILKNAKHKENAEAFINFINRPDVAQANSSFIHYSTPNRGAYDLLSEDLKANEIAYPSPDRLRLCETFVNLPPETVALTEELWLKIRK